MLPRPSRIYDLPERLERIVYSATGSRGILRLINEDLSCLKKPTKVGFFYTDIAML